jgi:hypothetical protein
LCVNGRDGDRCQRDTNNRDDQISTLHFAPPCRARDTLLHTLLARSCYVATRGARLDSAVQLELWPAQAAGPCSPRTEQHSGSGIPPRESLLRRGKKNRTLRRLYDG